MTLEELKRYREQAELCPDEVFDLAEAMIRLMAVAEKTQGIVGVYRTSWRDDPVWMVDCDYNLTTLGEEESESLPEAIQALHDDLCD
jgi:hypothetical protein